MTQGIRTVHLATFACCALWVACRPAPDTTQLTAVDQMITATDAAMLTLNELDHARYRLGDSLYVAQGPAFAMRFRDTLDRSAAQALGDQFIALRAAASMGAEHERVSADIIDSGERLRTLRADIANGAVASERGASLIAQEQQRHASLVDAVHRVMDNYRTLQQAWARRDTVNLLLAETTAP